MKRGLTLFVLLLIGLCSLLPVYGQDANPTPEPKTRADNECYAGGTMAGKCDRGFHADGSTTPAEVAWAWRCGWYLARFNDHVIGREVVPQDCSSVMPGPSRGDCVIAFGGRVTECLLDGILSNDLGNDGSFEHSWHVIVSSVKGDGGVCPGGTVFVVEVGHYTFEPVFYHFLLDHGYMDTDDFCFIS